MLRSFVVVVVVCVYVCVFFVFFFVCLFFVLNVYNYSTMQKLCDYAKNSAGNHKC